MTQILGPQNILQTGTVNGSPHAIEKIGSHTGHSVRAIAYCDSAETAEMFVEAIRMLRGMYEMNPRNGERIKALLEKAGVL